MKLPGQNSWYTNMLFGNAFSYIEKKVKDNKKIKVRKKNTYRKPTKSLKQHVLEHVRMTVIHVSVKPVTSYLTLTQQINTVNPLNV